MLEQLRRIREVSPQRPSRLRIIYDDGQTIEIDFAAMISRGGVFAPLAEWDVFAKVRVDSRGRSVLWPGEIDFCADALWIEAQGLDQRHAG